MQDQAHNSPEDFEARARDLVACTLMVARRDEAHDTPVTRILKALLLREVRARGGAHPLSDEALLAALEDAHSPQAEADVAQALENNHVPGARVNREQRTRLFAELREVVRAEMARVRAQTNALADDLEREWRQEPGGQA